MPRQWTRLIEFLHSSNVRVFAQYGMSECSGALRCQLRGINDTAVPIGYPLLEFQCLLIGEQGPKIRNKNNASEIGQIHISGKQLLLKKIIGNCFSFLHSIKSIQLLLA
jgi:hypothetical protein